MQAVPAMYSNAPVGSLQCLVTRWCASIRASRSSWVLWMEKKIEL